MKSFGRAMMTGVLAMSLGASTLAAVPAEAQARYYPAPPATRGYYGHNNGYYGNGYYNGNRSYYGNYNRHNGVGPGTGALIGGAAGVLLGGILGGGKGALIGGAAGAGVGAAAGAANQNSHRRYYGYGY